MHIYINTWWCKLKIKLELVNRDAYTISVDDKKLFLASEGAVVDIIERLIYDHVVESVEITIKNNCEGCEQEALDIIRN